MRKVILTYGLIAGTILAAMTVISIPFWNNGTLNFDNGELVGYTTMVVACSLIFFGVKTYRDNYAGGVVTFWQATKVGLLIYLVAAVLYAGSWEVSINYMPGDFMQMMMDYQVESEKADGATAAEIEEVRKTWESFGKMYENPVLRFVLTMFELLPVALVFILGSAALLRMKDFLPAGPRVTNAVN